MIGILGGMGTQAGLDFCNKLAKINRGKIDQEYPLFILYNKSNIPGRPESIGVQTKNLSNKLSNNTSKKKYNQKSLLVGLYHDKKSWFRPKIKKLILARSQNHAFSNHAFSTLLRFQNNMLVRDLAINHALFGC